MATRLPLMQSPPGPEITIDGHRYLYFGGTSYLGLAGHPEVVEAACAAVRQYGVHSATTRSGFGTNPATLAVEQQAAAFFGTEDAFYYSSGYAGNNILLQTLAERVDVVFLDQASHYSLAEAARLLGKPIVYFKHRDAADLAQHLDNHRSVCRYPLVASDGVFSVSGALAPVREYLQVLQARPPAALHLDDAHGMGVLGASGCGLLEHCELWKDRANTGVNGDGVMLSVCGTFSKALGGFGGVIPGTTDFLRRVRAASHYFAGASAPSSADAGATAKALEIIRREPEWRKRLQTNSALLRGELRRIGLDVPDDPTAHFSVTLGQAATMRDVHQRLRHAGFIVPYIPAYSGTAPQGALRFATCALHTPAMINGLVAALERVRKSGLESRL